MSLKSYLLIDLFNALTPSQRKKFYLLQLLVVLMALSEMVGLVAIGIFMMMVGDVNIIYHKQYLLSLYVLTGAASPLEFTSWMGVAVMLLLMIVAIVSIFTTRRLTFFGIAFGAEIGDQLYRYYMHKPWLFHASVNSSHLTKQIATEADRVSGVIITPLMQVNAKLALVVFMSAAIVVFDPEVAIYTLAVFVAIYIAIYKFVRLKLARNSPIISETATERYKLMSEGFGGIKDVLLLGRQSDFVERFESSSGRYADSVGSNQFLVLVPRIFIELTAYGVFILYVLFLINNKGAAAGSMLSTLSVYGVAGFKLMPAFQQIYNNIAQIKGNLSAFESIKDDLGASCGFVSGSNVSDHSQKMHVTRNIILRDVEFSYPGKCLPTLNNLNVTICANKLVAFVGASGAGKTTIVDLILGLIRPDKGALFVDGEPITENNIRNWQNSLGYVSQTVFLSDASIVENIAFGLSFDSINIARVKQVAVLAHLEEFLSQLPDGLYTKVGERGVQLSGGQRQRIGIARALYHESDVLVFDEATSALDGISEKIIMDAIHDFIGKKTIVVIAHRLKTVEKCDVIFLMDGGRLVDQGTYNELVHRNPIFNRMAQHS